ncbi:MAG TPA: carboxypeptidase-like regulatory domain-containing protein [Cytophagaceae bacterium]|nr:carboxypeptidase-like regulatory domain-containing protein [Cytophagaceae bacterium]
MIGKIKILFLLIALFSISQLQAQNTSKVVQVSGLVVSGDSLYGVPGVAVYIPKSGRGTVTNYVGYFSLPALIGDSLIINSVGFKSRRYTVPDTLRSDKMSLIIELVEDTLMLPVIEIFPWPTEQLFKEAFLSLKLPEQDMNNMNQNLNEQVLKRMLYSTSASGAENHRYYMQKQVQVNDTRYNLVSPALTFSNPFAWSRFISDVKKKRFKSTLRDRDDYYNDDDDEEVIK